MTPPQERWREADSATFLAHGDAGIDHPDRLLDPVRWLEAAGFVSVDVHWCRAGYAVFGGVAPARPGLTPRAPEI